MADELICLCRKRFPSTFRIDADLRIPLDASPVSDVFGPSGAGKTACLPPQERRASFLFQDHAFFPHLTVAQNIALGAHSRQKTDRIIDAFGLGEFRRRLPRAISGGQQQRLALARALAADPALLLLDEPLSALDAGLRARIRQELRRTLLSSGIPALLVTHDRAEAIALGDWIAVIVEALSGRQAPFQRYSASRPIHRSRSRWAWKISSTRGLWGGKPACLRSKPGPRNCSALTAANRVRLRLAFAPRMWPSRATCTRRPARATESLERFGPWRSKGRWRASKSIADFCWWPSSPRNRQANSRCEPARPVCAIVKATAVHLLAQEKPWPLIRR
jgi:energy-coupling factor transporter ATP-binding protein EcfA2